MKHLLIPIYLLLSSICFPSIAQVNKAPELANLNWSKNDQTNQITLTYDLNDAENDSIEISIVTLVEGRVVKAMLNDLTGDVGYPVMTGNSKKIVGNYDKQLIQHMDKGVQIRIIANDLYEVPLEQLVHQVDTNRIKKRVKTVYGVRGAKGRKAQKRIDKVKDYIHSTFDKEGLAVIKQEIDFDEYTGHNIIGKIAGQSAPEKMYLLTAHFDSSSESPGADDNASGVAGMMEIAHILSSYGFKHSLGFVAFDLEEAGLLGSEAYITKGGILENEDIQGVINFDMIGYYTEEPNTQFIPEGFDQLFPEAYKQVASDDFKGNFVLNTANTSSVKLSEQFKKAAATYTPSLKVIMIEAYENGKYTPNLAASDHANFWHNGMKAIHVGDGGESRNVHLNSPQDTMGMLNYSFISDIVKATLTTLCEMAELQHTSEITIDLSNN